MIKVSNLQKIFTTEEVETTALNGIDLEIKDGEFVAIMGPSGCGKSTLLNILGLLDTASDGEYKLSGASVDSLSSHRRAHFRSRHGSVRTPARSVTTAGAPARPRNGPALPRRRRAWRR